MRKAGREKPKQKKQEQAEKPENRIIRAFKPLVEAFRKRPEKQERREPEYFSWADDVDG